MTALRPPRLPRRLRAAALAGLLLGASLVAGPHLVDALRDPFAPSPLIDRVVHDALARRGIEPSVPPRG